MNLRSGMRTGAVVLLALLLNAGLLLTAALLASERPIPQDISEPQAVSLVKLKDNAPPPAEPEPEIPEPQEKPQLDFMPELAAPSITGPDPLDVSIALDPSLFQSGPSRGSFTFNSEDLDQPPRKVLHVDPVYSYRLRQRNISGEVQVKFLVSAEGVVSHISILEATPKGVFNESVKTAVAGWKFSPGKIDGRAVPSWVVTNVVFNLSN